jgi:serine/threonine protein kinase
MAFDPKTYQILHMIAAGGMAEVFLARQRMLEGIDRLVVVKRLLPDLRDDEEFITMFLDEARIATSIRHPHVVQLYDAARFQEDVFLVLEYVDGVSLRRVLDAAVARKCPLSAADAAGIGLTLADTLAHVHEAQDERGKSLHIVHRDLTPANVLISWTGVIKLIDFGIARGDNRVYETATGMVKGTAGYMAPEQLREGTLDARTDIFALGVVLYELFTGVHPFAAGSMYDLYDVIVHGRFAPPRVAQPDIPLRGSTLIIACLQGEPANRPQSMREVAFELQRVLNELGHVPTFRGVAKLVAELVDRSSAPSVRGMEPSQLETDVERPTKVQRKPK